MRVQNKLLAFTLALVLLLIVVTGVLVTRYSERTCLERAGEQMQALADTLALQMEARIQQMDFSLLFMLSEPDFLSAVSYYTMPGRASAENRLLVSDSASVISRTMMSYAVSKSFYRATLYTTDGDYFSSRFLEPVPSAARVREALAAFAWTEKADAQLGRMLLLSPYADPWASDGRMVYGVVRALRTASGKACYIEIQNDAAELDALLEAALLSGMRARVEGRDGAAFCAPDEKATEDADDIAVCSAENAYGLSVRLWQGRGAALSMLGPFRVQIVALCAVATLLSATYLYFASRRLTQPLRAIRQTMEQTALDTLDNPRLPSGGDELQALGEAFGSLCERLKSSMDAQLRARERETRARFDALQAQIDPHFLYNTLNVIAGRAMRIGDDEIVAMCEEIADMLRYSTDTRERAATVGREAAHLSTYLALMKKRYRQKLEYTVDIAPEMEGVEMPKIVLQQFAENAIRHGLGGAAEPLRFSLRGFVANGRWVIEMEDSGKGFAPDVLQSLRETLRACDAPDAPVLPGGGLSIGGIGIVNTYARLRAFYGGGFQMELENAEKGARVRLSAPGTEEKPCGS